MNSQTSDRKPASRGFTLVEIIAVLMILGLLAALASVKFASLHNEARTKAAMAALDEVKSRYSTAYGKYLLLNNGALPTSVSAVLSDAEATDLGSDFAVTVSTTADTATITVTTVQGVALSPPLTGSWAMPIQ